jgi:hypothetical protein
VPQGGNAVVAGSYLYGSWHGSDHDSRRINQFNR